VLLFVARIEAYAVKIYIEDATDFAIECLEVCCIAQIKMLPVFLEEENKGNCSQYYYEQLSKYNCAMV